MYKRFIFCLLLWLVAVPGFGAVDRFSESRVERYFSDLTSLRTDFVQTVFDEQSRVLETSSGRMYMQRPGRFRWDYREPFEQMILADGERLWHYDSELEQVTVREMDNVLGSTPLALLSGAAPIEEVFTVDRVAQRDGMQWYELHPKNTQADFKVLRVAFKNDSLSAIELEDVFNQRTRLRFAHLERNVDIDPSLWRFRPPPGVDVVGDAP